MSENQVCSISTKLGIRIYNTVNIGKWCHSIKHQKTYWQWSCDVQLKLLLCYFWRGKRRSRQVSFDTSSVDLASIPLSWSRHGHCFSPDGQTVTTQGTKLYIRSIDQRYMYRRKLALLAVNHGGVLFFEGVYGQALPDISGTPGLLLLGPVLPYSIFVLTCTLCSHVASLMPVVLFRRVVYSYTV